MKRSWWQTGPSIKHTQPIRRPTSGQRLRQLALLALLLLIWGGGFSIFIGAANAAGPTTVAMVSPTATTEPVPTKTPMLAPSTTPAPTATRPATKPAFTVTPEPAVIFKTTTTAVPTETSTPGATSTIAATAAGGAQTAASFQRDVQPIFDQICVKCHGGEEVKEGLSLKTYAEIMQGSNNGPVIAPGDPANSLLVDMIKQGKMPKRGPKLLPKQIQAIVDWVAAGAPNN
jgi:cytochrome c